MTPWRKRMDASCQWPEGDPLEDNFRFCGAPAAAPGHPYCPAHRDRAYATPADREADREIWLAIQRDQRPKPEEAA